MATTSGDTSRPFRLPRPHHLAELTPDQTVAVLLRLAMEICVLRDRLTTHERLLSERGLMSLDDIEEFTPSVSEAADRREARDELIEKIINDLS